MFIISRRSVFACSSILALTAAACGVERPGEEDQSSAIAASTDSATDPAPSVTARPGPCDDGSPVLCEMVPPRCKEGYVLARRNSCYECLRLDCSTPSRCDDAPYPICDMIAPRCPAGTEAAVRNGCWACVDPDTCRVPPERCGGIAGLVCSDRTDACIYPDGTCNVADNMGVCTPRGDACIALYDPVCGCDRRTYGNRCEATRAGVSVAYEGVCRRRRPATDALD